MSTLPIRMVGPTVGQILNREVGQVRQVRQVHQVLHVRRGAETLGRDAPERT